MSSCQSALLKLPQHQWLASALLIENSWQAVASVCENAEDILEPEDFEGDPVWLSAKVPLQWRKPEPSAFEPLAEWNDRLRSLRSIPLNKVIPIILFMDAAGDIEIIDGYHRIALSMERGHTTISALVRYENFRP